MRVHETLHSGARWARNSPIYRVNFWQESGEAWALDTFVLSEVSDVTEVLRWVEERRRGRVVEVFVEAEAEPIGESPEERTAGLVRVLGVNPNAGVATEVQMVRPTVY